MKARSVSKAAFLVALPLVLGGALRLYHAWSCRAYYAPSLENEEGYYERGLGLLSCHVLGLGIPETHPTAGRGALYPAFIALVESPFKRPSPGRVRLAQALLSTAAIAAVFALGWLILGPWAAFVSALWTALDADQIAALSLLNVHAFYSLTLLALAAALVLWLEDRRPRAALLAAFALAASLLCRSAHFPFPLLLLAACAFLWKLPEGVWRAVRLPTLLTALFLSPLLTRNALHFRRFIPLDAYAGSFVFLKATVGSGHSCSVEEALALAQTLEPGFTDPGLQGERLHRELLRLAVQNALAHPLRYAWYCLRRLANFWSVFWLPLLLGACALLLERKNHRLQAAALVCASLSGYAFAGGSPDHRPAPLPLLALLAGCGLTSLLARLRLLPAGAPRPAHEAAWALKAYLAPFALIYATLVAFLALDLKEQWWPNRRAAEPASASCDEREVDILRLEYAASGRRRGADAFLSALESRASAECRRGDYARAHARMKELLMADPGHARALENMARCFLEAGRAQEARPYAERLKALARDANERARALLIYGALSMSLKDYARAEREFRAALDAQPNNRDALAALAAVFLAQGRKRAALSYADRLVAATAAAAPDLRAQARSVRGRILLNLKDVAGAERDFAVAIAADPDNRDALYGMIACLERHPAQALSYADRLVAATAAAAPDERARALLKRADVNLALGDEAAAARDLETVVRWKNCPPQPFLSLAALHQRRGQTRQAMAILEAGAALPANASPANRALLAAARAALLFRLGRRGQAERGLDAALDAEPRVACLLAPLPIERNRVDEAFFTRCLKRLPGEAALHLDRGVARHLSGNPAAAAADFEKALELKPGFVEAALSLAATLQSLGRPAEARAALERALAACDDKHGKPYRLALRLRESLR